MTLNRRLINHDHTHEFTVIHDTEGWEIREEEDSRVLRQAHHDDWHRVERDTQRFELRIFELKRDGWTEN